MKKLIRLILSRTSFILLLLLLQILLFIVLLEYLANFPYVSWIMYGITFLIVLYLLYNETNPVYKISWIIPILLFPLFGGVFYLFYKQRNVNKKVLHRFTFFEESRYLYFENILTYDPNHHISTYLKSTKNFSDYHTKTTYLNTGTSMFESMKTEMKKAKKYIFLQFFIIKTGKMLDEILDILKTKINEGVEVFIIYDDFGSSTLPYHYKKSLQKLGINTFVFNPMRFHLNFAMNYRNHQKIVIIDGKIVFTGGMNIGDEYINLESPYGYWKDAGIMLEGPACSPFVYNAFHTINFIEKNAAYNFKKYIYQDFDLTKTYGITIPFTDSPMDQELTNKNVYFSLITQAKKSIYITTPYLIIDNELKTALIVAARSGVDVHIIIPYIPDKKIVYMVTKSYAEELAKENIHIHQYKKGFIHSKMIVVDEQKAMIGTANLDFRSLYLHFENSVYLENNITVKAMIEDIHTIIDESINLIDAKPSHMLTNLLKYILRGFSSIM